MGWFKNTPRYHVIYTDDGKPVGMMDAVEFAEFMNEFAFNFTYEPERSLYVCKKSMSVGNEHIKIYINTGYLISVVAKRRDEL